MQMCTHSLFLYKRQVRPKLCYTTGVVFIFYNKVAGVSEPALLGSFDYPDSQSCSSECWTTGWGSRAIPDSPAPSAFACWHN